MTDILKKVKQELSTEDISSTVFEGANIVLYTNNKNFFLHGERKIKEVVNKIKKRIDLRADESILTDKKEAKQGIKKVVPEDANITNINFDVKRSIVVIEAKKPGLVIGKRGSVLNKIKEGTLWSPQVQRSPSIRSKITENIRSVLYQNNTHRRRFLNKIGKKIYKDWSPEKVDEWVRLTFLGGARQVGRSCLLLHTPESKILLDCGVDVAAKGREKFPYLNVSEIDIKAIDAVVLSHAHVDHSGLIPYLYKMGYKGPTYMTRPTRDIASLLALDFIDVAYKQASTPLYSSRDIKEMVKHTICLDYNEVTDISPDVRLTLYNAGHVLGSSMAHLNIGNGLHNLLYAADFKNGKTKLLNPSVKKFPRLETAIIESTYGGKKDKLPSRKNAKQKLIGKIKETIDRGGKILVPELGLGRSQETMLVIEEAIRKGKLPKIPIYIDGMIWDINAIHTAYPDFLSGHLKNMIFQDQNPFMSDIFQQVGSPKERKEVIEGGPCLVLATSGMLVGGSSVEYLKNFSENSKNSVIFVCYQPPGGLGRQLQSGSERIRIETNGEEKEVDVNLDVNTIEGFTGHSGRNELLSFINRCKPKPRKVIVNHGEVGKCLDLASTLHKLNRIETICPRNLETLRIK